MSVAVWQSVILSVAVWQFLSVICILYDVRVFVCLVYMDLLCVCVCVESVDIASSSPPSVLLSGWVVVRLY